MESVIPLFILNSFLFKLFVASVLGAAIGFERDIHGRAAGLRTHLLVSLGAAVFMILSESIAISYSSPGSQALFRVDPSRIAAQIITGIGFLGAGAIIKSGMSIRGLTTAACLWLSAAIGMSIGAGYYMIGVAATLLGLFTLVFLNRVERLYAKDSYRVLKVIVALETDISDVIDIVKRSFIKILFLDIERDYEQRIIKATFTIRLNHKGITDKLHHDLVDDLEQSNIKLHNIKWTHQYERRGINQKGGTLLGHPLFLWRRRDSNPRPTNQPYGVYMLVLFISYGFPSGNRHRP